MLFNTATIVAGIAALLAIPEVAAGGISMKPRASKKWGCDGRSAPVAVRNRCSGRGSFYMTWLGGTCCVNPNAGGTWHSGYDDDRVCPFNWGQHTLNKCCIPKTEVSKCDCGEGYTFNQQTLKCEKTTSPSCKNGQWYHGRSGACCDNSWEHNPPKGNCPPGVKCPTGWFWHPSLGKCRPKGCRTPEPDCDDWNEQHQCCGTPPGPNPSKKPTNPGHGGGHGGGWGWHHKKDLDSQTTFDHAMYCGDKKACSVPTEDGSWSYECLDTSSELESCGGCVSDGEGKNCLAIPFVAQGGVTCNLGACQVSKCIRGYQAVNGTSCAAI